MSSQAVNLESVSFVRNGRKILTDINWQIEKGTHWAVIGANGSGKTTLLKIITGYEWPSSGSVTVLGSRFGKCAIADVRKQIGWVSNSIAARFSPNNTAVEIILSGLDASIGMFRDFTKAEYDKAADLLSFLNAPEAADKPCKVLSQGETQRVIIARALINRPKLLIFDEPCAGLDPAAREDLLIDLEKLSRSGATIIFVTHHIEEIQPWMNDVLVLKDGRVFTKGKPHNVLTAELLSGTFDRQCRIFMKSDRYWMDMGETID